jgi:hypothetical protein
VKKDCVAVWTVCENACFMSFLSQLIASAVGGAVGGSFVIWGVKAQFRSQSRAACRALLVETKGNAKASKAMVGRPENSPWKEGGPNPGWLKSSVWTSQLPYIVQSLVDQRTLETVVEAYGTLDVVPEMVIRNMVSPGPAYSHGGWIDRHIWKIMQTFNAAENALDGVVAGFKPPWYKRALAAVRTLTGGRF